MVSELLQAFPWVRSAIEIARATTFLLFVLLGLRVIWLERRHRETVRAVRGLIIYTIIITCAVGVTQIEAWPFTNWALVHHVSQKTIESWSLKGLDASGNAWCIDTRFIEPLPYEDFDVWLKLYFLPLGRTPEELEVCFISPLPPSEQQKRVAAFVLARAEAARLRFRATGHAGTRDRFLGKAAAPYHFARPEVWRTSNDTPVSPFVGLQIWEEQWNVEERFADETRVRRRLLFEYKS